MLCFPPPPHPGSRACGDRVAGPSVTSIWCKIRHEVESYLDDIETCGATMTTIPSPIQLLYCKYCTVMSAVLVETFVDPLEVLGSVCALAAMTSPPHSVSFNMGFSSLRPSIYFDDFWRICFLLSSHPHSFPPPSHDSPPSLPPFHIVNSVYPSPFRPIRAQSFSLDSTSERHQSIEILNFSALLPSWNAV